MILLQSFKTRKVHEISGGYLDQNLSWNEQCDRLCMHIPGPLVLCRMRSFVKPGLLKLLLQKTIQPVFDYAYTAWRNTSQGNMYQLRRAQNYAARPVLGNFLFYQLRMWRYCQIVKLANSNRTFHLYNCLLDVKGCQRPNSKLYIWYRNYGQKNSWRGYSPVKVKWCTYSAS